MTEKRLTLQSALDSNIDIIMEIPGIDPGASRMQSERSPV